MKTIAVVTNSNSRLAKFLKNNLQNIFKGFVKINNYYIDDLKDDSIIKDDIVLFMIKEKALECEKYVQNKKNTIIIERTLRDSEIYKLFTLPKNTKALVINDSKETTLETVSLLYQIGISNLQLIAYEPDKIYEDINIAITPDEEEHVPKYIETIINVGNRCIDTTTFIKIINKLNIEDKRLSERVINYSESIINLNNGIKENYRQLYVANEELDIIINSSKEGFLLIDNEENISFYNNAFKNIFYIREDIKGKKIGDVLDKEVVNTFTKEIIKDEILELKGRYINVNKQIVKSLGQNIGYCFNIQEVTYIKQLEQNLSKKLRNKGLIAKYDFNDILTNSVRMKECISLAKKIASSDLTALITGESGTGKEVLAQSIHNASNRSKQPFVAINCAALPESLLESELFGYEGGSFTGALKEGKAGLFEQAHNGTIFLDEIGDMPLSLQTRMLRVIQERQVMRIGSQSVIDINVRIIAATHRNLMQMINEGKFREDLFYRLNVLPINIPPLRERKEDIILILESSLNGKKNLKLSKDVVDLLLNYTWPGNIRELKNAADYIELMSDEEIKIENIPFYILNCNVDYKRECDYLNDKCNVENALEILEIIEEKNSSNMGVGRKNIEEALKNRSRSITEAEVRRILTILNDLGIITSSLGRRGSELTVKGRNFIKWIKNRIN
ncbi:sigma 54-interacting transcriptional regulator [Clostridium aciditolerans]|uniref:Sigma 54-interacting transcriptional regulator n=1 Tax=Clostridium aciditolerans TaxID=339861 RepID=A0A934HVI2_9CLOT|nr:sigma 54-interacting transcriptional regulator [Clostridium aciditolerans]MBI6871598.1 sigma 54-interacting transcriptional regulator [Clostridium aciditolerans]